MRLQLGIGPGNCRVTPLLGGVIRDSGDSTCIARDKCGVFSNGMR